MGVAQRSGSEDGLYRHRFAARGLATCPGIIGVALRVARAVEDRVRSTTRPCLGYPKCPTHSILSGTV
jgi:hypothetical protein